MLENVHPECTVATVRLPAYFLYAYCSIGKECLPREGFCHTRPVDRQCEERSGPRTAVLVDRGLASCVEATTSKTADAATPLLAFRRSTQTRPRPCQGDVAAPASDPRLRSPPY